MSGVPKGHPFFLAQHATATCCRGCLEKWHGIPGGRELTEHEQQYVVYIILELFKTKVDIIHNLRKDDIMAEMCGSRLPPCDKGEERVDREQERLLEEFYAASYSVGDDTVLL